MFGDRRVDDALRAEFVQQPLRYLVGALIFGDLLAHHEHVRIATHFFSHGVAQRLAHGHGDEFGAFGYFGLRRDVSGRRLPSTGLCRCWRLRFLGRVGFVRRWRVFRTFLRTCGLLGLTLLTRRFLAVL